MPVLIRLFFIAFHLVPHSEEAFFSKIRPKLSLTLIFVILARPSVLGIRRKSINRDKVSIVSVNIHAVCFMVLPARHTPNVPVMRVHYLSLRHAQIADAGKRYSFLR